MSGYSIKDYRNKENYKSKSSICFWKWEFLRRNDKYQVYYENSQWVSYWRELLIEEVISIKEFKRYYSKEKVLNADLAKLFYGNILLDPRDDDVYSLVPAPTGLRLPKIFDYAEKQEKLKSGEIKKMTSDHSILVSLLETLTHLQINGRIMVSLDLNIPLDIQIKMIKDLFNQNGIKTYKQSFKNYRPKEWLFYLRVIDGINDGHSYDEIASNIFPNEINSYPNFAVRKKIIKAYKRGMELMNDFAIGGSEAAEHQNVTKKNYLQKFFD